MLSRPSQPVEPNAHSVSNATGNPLKGAKVLNAYLLGGRSNRCVVLTIPTCRIDFSKSTDFSNYFCNTIFAPLGARKTLGGDVCDIALHDIALCDAAWPYAQAEQNQWLSFEIANHSHFPRRKVSHEVHQSPIGITMEQTP